jgi:hypothetical protein
VHCIGTNGAILKACSSVEGNLRNTFTYPSHFDYYCSYISLITSCDTSWVHIGLCAFLFCHPISETSQFKRQLWSAFFFQGPVFKVFGCWTISLSVWVQFSSQFYLRRIIFRRFRKMAQSYYTLRRVCISVRPSPSAWNSSAPTGQILMEFDVRVFFIKSIEKIQLSFNSASNLYCTFHDVSTFMIISRLILLRMRNISDNSCWENQNTHIVFRNFFKNRAICEIMWKNMVKPDRPLWI